jgi:hypothetical protein
MSDVTCQQCTSPSTLFLCQRCMDELHAILTEMPWWLDRLAETSVGQARLGEPGRRGHRSGLEKYANDKPAMDGEGTEGQRRLEQDLKDSKLRQRLLAQGGVNAHASDLFDDVQNMLSGWVRDVCERRGLYWVEAAFIGPLKANEMRYAPQTASAMATWLGKCVPSLAAAECAKESFADIKRAAGQMERAVNRAPSPKTCGPCPTLGHHREVDGKPRFDIDAESRTKCGTRLEARANAAEVRCPTCKQTHNVEALIDRLANETHYMSFTIRELVDIVLPRANEHIPRRTLYDWAAKGLMEPTGSNEEGKPKYLLADVRRLRATHRKDKAA